MPLNALQIVDQFKMKSQAERSAEQANQFANQLKMGESLRALKNRNVLGELMKGNPSDLGAVATDYMTQTGDADGMMRLQDRAYQEEARANQREDRGYQKELRDNQREDRKHQNSIRALDTHLKGLDWMSKTGTMVTKDNYAQWRAKAVELGVASPADLPETYDQDLMDRLTGAASAELKEIKINLPGGMQQQIWRRGNKELYRSAPYERFAPNNAARSGDIAIMDRLLSSGIAKDEAEAWRMLQDYKFNPASGAASLTRMRVESQRDAGVMPGDDGYKSPEQIYEEVVASLTAGRRPAEKPSGPASLYSPESDAAQPNSSDLGSQTLDSPQKVKRAKDIRARYKSGELSKAEALRLLEEAARG